MSIDTQDYQTLAARLSPAEKMALKEELDLEHARRDPGFFVSYVMRDNNDKQFKLTEFHKEWQDFIPVDIGDADGWTGQIEAPREHGKTSQVLGRVIWEMGNNPNIRIRYICADDVLGGNILSEIRQNLELNKRVHKVFPNLKPSNRDWGNGGPILCARTAMMKDPTVRSSGVLSTGVGGRADLMIFDDVVSFRNAIYMPGLRETVKQSVNEVWLNLMAPNGRAIWISTPWHTDDMTCDLEKNPEWSTWKRPALDPWGTGIMDPDGHPQTLWPGKWTYDALMSRRGKIGDRAFSRQFMLNPLSEEEKTFTTIGIAATLDDETYMGALSPAMAKNYFGWHRAEPVPIARQWQWPIVAGLDLASSLEMKAAWNVLTIAAIAPDNRRHMIGVERWKGKFPETIKRIRWVWNFFRPSLIMVENNGYQQSVVDQLGEEAVEIPVMGFRTGGQKWDEAVGLPGMNVQMEKGAWVIGRQGNHEHVMIDDELKTFCSSCALVKELELHPQGKFQDAVMSMWFTEAAARLISQEGTYGGYVEVEVGVTNLFGKA